jgi:hypothetical protein
MDESPQSVILRAVLRTVDWIVLLSFDRRYRPAPSKTDMIRGSRSNRLSTRQLR